MPMEEAIAPPPRRHPLGYTTDYKIKGKALAKILGIFRKNNGLLFFRFDDYGPFKQGRPQKIFLVEEPIRIERVLTAKN